MRYYQATVLVGIDEDEIKEWSEGADVTFSIARKLNASGAVGADVILTSHIYGNISEKDALAKSIITPEGGI